jgi:hypothetical protein
MAKSPQRWRWFPPTSWHDRAQRGNGVRLRRVPVRGRRQKRDRVVWDNAIWRRYAVAAWGGRRLMIRIIVLGAKAV